MTHKVLYEVVEHFLVKRLSKYIRKIVTGFNFLQYYISFCYLLPYKVIFLVNVFGSLEIIRIFGVVDTGLIVLQNCNRFCELASKLLQQA